MKAFWRNLRNLVGSLLMLAAWSVMTEDRQDEWTDFIRKLP